MEKKIQEVRWLGLFRMTKPFTRSAYFNAMPIEWDSAHEATFKVMAANVPGAVSVRSRLEEGDGWRPMNFSWGRCPNVRLLWVTNIRYKKTIESDKIYFWIFFGCANVTSADFFSRFF
jgi:hypothetical protein